MFKRRDTPTASQGWWLHRRSDPGCACYPPNPRPHGQRDMRCLFQVGEEAGASQALKGPHPGSGPSWPHCADSSTSAPLSPPPRLSQCPPQPCTDKEGTTEQTRLDVGESERPSFLGSQQRHVGRIKSRFSHLRELRPGSSPSAVGRRVGGKAVVPPHVERGAAVKKALSPGRHREGPGGHAAKRNESL